MTTTISFGRLFKYNTVPQDYVYGFRVMPWRKWAGMFKQCWQQLVLRRKPAVQELPDIHDCIDILSQIVKSRSNMYCKAKTPILVNNRLFEDNVDSIDPGKVERVSFSTHADLPGDRDGNGIVIIHIKKEFHQGLLGSRCIA